MTSIDNWRAQERETISEFYGEVEKLVLTPKGERSASIAALEAALGVPAIKDGDTCHFRLATDWLELDLDEANRQFHAERIARWRSEINVVDADGPLEADAHVTHFHLKRIHGDRLSTLIGGKVPEHVPLRLFDDIQIDRVTLALLTRQASTIDEALYCPPNATLDQQIEIAEQALNRARHISAFKGLIVDGNDLTINTMLDDVTITYNYFNFRREVPEALLQSLPGRPLADAIEIDGLADSGLSIVKATGGEKSGVASVTIETDRFAKSQMVTLNPARHIALEAA